MMRKTLAAAMLAALAGPAAAQGYDACVALAERDPSAGLAQAEAWAQASGDPAAEHCAALALAGLGAHGAAARRIADLAARPGPIPAAARAEMLEQAADLWRRDGDAARARAALDAALRLAPGAATALEARAALSAAEGDDAAAAADLGDALATAPETARPALLTLRAAARRLSGDAAGALADARAALAALPEPGPARAEAFFEEGAALAALGEPAAARRAWLDAVAADPGSATADRAQLSLQGMDVR